MDGSLLIVNADDLGMTRDSTSAIVEAYDRGLITSTTAMVHMVDSERAAMLAAEIGIPAGLHLNLTESFTGMGVPHDAASRQRRIAGRMTASKYARWVFWPDLALAVAAAIGDQLAEFQRLYGCHPTHLDGHHHIHASANVLLSRSLPANLPLRSSFTFTRRERGLTNRALRRCVNTLIRRRHPTTDVFFSVNDLVGHPSEAALKLEQSRECPVEVMCHPAAAPDWAVLTSELWRDAMHSHGRLGDFRCLNRQLP